MGGLPWKVDEGLKDIGNLPVQGGEVRADGGEALDLGIGAEAQKTFCLSLGMRTSRSA
jgi:hypothetical protein